MIGGFQKSRYRPVIVIIISSGSAGKRPAFNPDRNPRPLPLLPAQLAGRTGVLTTVYAGNNEKFAQLRAALGPLIAST